MSADRMRDLLATPRARGARIARVVTYSAPNDYCTVLLAEGEFPASVPFHVISTIDVGTAVTILPVGETYEVISAHTSIGGPGGTLYGPELVPNNQFTYGATGSFPNLWKEFVTGDALLTWDDTPGQAVSGNERAIVTLSGAGVDPINHFTAMNSPVAIDEVPYAASVWLKASAVEASLTLTLLVFSAPTAAGVTFFGVGVASTTIATIAAPGSAYQLATGTFTPPVGHKYARLFLRTEADATDALVVSWDDASLRERITS